MFQHASTWPDIARNIRGSARSQFDHPTWHYVNGPVYLDPADRKALAGAQVRFLPADSPDLNPIELAFSKFKQLLRDGAQRTTEKLWELCGRVLGLFPKSECRNDFPHCGYRYR